MLASHHKRRECLRVIKDVSSLIKHQSKEKGIKTTWVQSNTSNKAIKSKGKSSVPKFFTGFCLVPVDSSPLIVAWPFPGHRSSDKRTFCFFYRNKTNTIYFVSFIGRKQIQMTRCIIASESMLLFLPSSSKQAIVKHLLCDQSKMELASNNVVTTSVTKAKTTVKVTGKP